MPDWAIRECPNCFGLEENCSTCSGTGQIEEVNTSYDQDQLIGDTPSDYPALGGEPIDAKTGDDFMTVKKLQEDTKPKKEYKNVWQKLDNMVKESYSKEKLNKDGTGVARATRGLDPTKTSARVLQFVYVSKSECETCKQYDGQHFPIDSPNRPVIPRLEKGDDIRPYTHPNCKCKWVRPFSKSGMKNFEQTRVSESLDFKPFTINAGKQTFKLRKKKSDTRKWDDLGEEEQLDWIIRGMVSSMKNGWSEIGEFKKIKEVFDKIEPKQKGISTESDSPYGIQKMLDMFVDKTLTPKEKNEIEEEHNLDFTLENLLRLVAEKLAEKAGKKMGLEGKVKSNESLLSVFKKQKPNFQNQNFKDYAKVFEDPIETKWNKQKYGLTDIFSDFKNMDWDELPNEIQDLFRATAVEGGVGSGKKGHQKWMRGAYAGEECSNCMIRTEKKDGKCAICGL
jgi:hypothetical protein